MKSRLHQTVAVRSTLTNLSMTVNVTLLKKGSLTWVI